MPIVAMDHYPWIFRNNIEFLVSIFKHEDFPQFVLIVLAVFVGPDDH